MSTRKIKTVFDFFAYCDKILSVPGRGRNGQIYFNCLVDARPDLADLVRNTEADPFYSDDRINLFKKWIEFVWDTPPGATGKSVPVPAILFEM